MAYSSVREMPQVDDLIERAKEIYLPIGADWREQPRQFRMPGAAVVSGFVRLRTFQMQLNTKASRSAIAPSKRRAILKTLSRSTCFSGRCDPRVACQSNSSSPPTQGGVSQHNGSSIASYIDPAPRGMQPLVRKLSNGAEHRYIYIPSRIQDNRILLAERSNLHQPAASRSVRRNWCARVSWRATGTWSPARFFPRVFRCPSHHGAAHVARSPGRGSAPSTGGSARPFAVHWWAVSDGSIPDIGTRGCLVCYRRVVWYEAERGRTWGFV